MTGLRCSSTDLWVVAQTAWAESREASSVVRYALVWTIRNRTDRHPRWQGMAFLDICRAPMQYACWDPGGRELRHLRQVSLDDRAFCACLVAAVEVMGGLVLDPTLGSTHYAALGTPAPPWAAGHAPAVVIGGWQFFSGIP